MGRQLMLLPLCKLHQYLDIFLHQFFVENSVMILGFLCTSRKIKHYRPFWIGGGWRMLYRLVKSRTHQYHRHMKEIESQLLYWPGLWYLISSSSPEEKNVLRLSSEL